MPIQNPKSVISKDDEDENKIRPLPPVDLKAEASSSVERWRKCKSWVFLSLGMLVLGGIFFAGAIRSSVVPASAAASASAPAAGTWAAFTSAGGIGAMSIGLLAIVAACFVAAVISVGAGIWRYKANKKIDPDASKDRTKHFDRFAQQRGNEVKKEKEIDVPAKTKDATPKKESQKSKMSVVKDDDVSLNDSWSVISRGRSGNRWGRSSDSSMTSASFERYSASTGGSSSSRSTSSRDSSQSSGRTYP